VRKRARARDRASSTERERESKKAGTEAAGGRKRENVGRGDRQNEMENARERKKLGKRETERVSALISGRHSIRTETR